MKTIKQTLFLLGCAVFSLLGTVLLADSVVTAACGGVNTSIVNCDAGAEPAGVKDSGLWEVLIIAINILTSLVGVAALIGVIYGSVLYTSAGGNMEQTKKGMQIIGNVVIGVIAFGLMYVGLNFLIPGGVFA